MLLFSRLHHLQYIVFGSVILYFGRDIFIPLAFASLISFVLYPFCSWLEKKKVSRTTAISIALSILVALFLVLVALLAKQFFDFLKEWPAVQVKLEKSLQQFSYFLTDSVGISKDQQSRWLLNFFDQTATGFVTFIHRAISLSAVSLVMLILVPVYAFLILYYRNLWIEILFRLFPAEKKESIREMLLLSVSAYYNFIKGMGIVYVIVAILNSAGLLLLGVPHAILFGIIASVLTFIPYIGILAGSLLPITMAWVTFDSIWYPLGIIAIFTFVQYLEANVIFPMAVGNRLKVNTLAVLIAIFLGGILWGAAGMILFVPFLGILKLMADHNPELKTLSMALGTTRPS